MGNSHKFNTFYPSTNVLQNTSQLECLQQFELDMLLKFLIISLEKYVKEKISKCIGKYVTVFWICDMSSVFLSVTSESTTVASFISEIGAPDRLTVMCITLFFTLGFVKLFLGAMKNKRDKHKKIEIIAKSKSNSIESIMLEAMPKSDISGKDYVFINDEV